MTEPHIYASPDLRKQTIQDAETFIQIKRSRRLVLVQSYKEKTEGKLQSLKGKELDLFTSRVTRVENAKAKVNEALQKLENAIENLSSSNSNIANIENQERLL